MTVHVFGVRHHGPGCARSLRSALEALEPDAVLVEGPPDGDALLPSVLDAEMRPPVALLVYRPDLPSRAAFYPFAAFSPEWQGLCYALERGIPARFIDLPQAVQLAAEPDDAEEHGPQERVREDPIGLLAEAAGYADSELWWEEAVERRTAAEDLFEAILEAMTAVRAELEAIDKRDLLREAHMRQKVRAAQKEGFQRVAVICGAWHAPALVGGPSAKDDAALLTGLPRVRVDATWIPWTHYRLSFYSGYGAGILAPGWYQHLWTASQRATVEWVAKAAQILREERLAAPASGVIDAVRLAETLAALRDRRSPGLEELRESILTVLCDGQDAPLQLIRHRLEIGDVMGAVPPGAVAVPLLGDVEAQQRRLRLRPDETAASLDLDLRKETDRGRSHLLHRLRLLGVPWGTPQQHGASHRHGGGTFHELWQLKWEVEFPLRLIEMNVWGNTLIDAAGSFVRHRATTETDLPQLTDLLHETVLAELPDALPGVLQAIQNAAAISGEVGRLMGALSPLAQVARYGDVRGTPVEALIPPIVDGLFERIVIGLPGACLALDDDAAAEILAGIAGVEESVRLLDHPEMRKEWQEVLRHLSLQDRVHALLRSRCCRLLLEAGAIDASEVQRLARLALSPGTPAGDAAAWIEGLLRGSGLLLIHHDGLWSALDGWLQGLDGAVFAETLPLLRRAFSGFQNAERRMMAEKVRRLAPAEAHRDRPLHEQSASYISGDVGINPERARLVLPVLAQILGEETHG